MIQYAAYKIHFGGKDELRAFFSKLFCKFTYIGLEDMSNTSGSSGLAVWQFEKHLKMGADMPHLGRVAR